MSDLLEGIGTLALRWNHFKQLLFLLFLSVPVFSPLHAQPDSQTPITELELVEIARLGRGWVSDLSWTADGSAILAASYTGVWRYGLDGSETLLSPITGSVISPNYIAHTVENRPTITALSTGEALDLQPPMSGAALAAISPDETLLALIDSTGIQFWSLPDGELQNTIALDKSPLKWGLSFSPDNRMFAATFNLPRENAQIGEPRTRDDIFIWDVQTGTLITTLTTDGQDSIVTSTRFSSDGSRLITARIGGVTVFDLVSGEITRLNLPALPPERENTDFRITDRAVFFGNDTRIAAAWTETYPGEAMLSYITIWDTESGEIISEMDGIAGWVVGLTVSPDGKELALYNYEGSILVWDGRGEAQILTDQHPAIGETLAIHGDTLAVGGFDRGVRLWSLSERELITTIFAHNSSVTAVAFSSDGLLASASLFDTWTWDAENGIQDIDLPPFAPLALSFDGETVYGVSGNTRTILWSSTSEGVEQRDLNVNARLGAAEIGRAAVHTDGGEIIVYTRTGEVKTRFTVEGEIAHLRMSPNAALLLVGGAQSASMWRIDANPRLLWSAESDGRVAAAAFSPDNRFIAIVTRKGTLEVRGRDDGALIAATNLPYSFYGVTFSPDSSMVIGALNTQLILWQLE